MQYLLGALGSSTTKNLKLMKMPRSVQVGFISETGFVKVVNLVHSVVKARLEAWSFSICIGLQTIGDSVGNVGNCSGPRYLVITSVFIGFNKVLPFVFSMTQ